MTTAALRTRRPALRAGAAGLALAGLLLTACGGGSSAESATTTGTEVEVVESATASDSAVEAPAAGDSSDDSAGSSGAAVPDGWPAEVLVPAGETVLTSERGEGWDLLIEGIDESELKSLIEQMTANGFTSPGITDMGSGAWIAELTGPIGVVDYSYESGGAGEPNVHVIYMP